MKKNVIKWLMPFFVGSFLLGSVALGLTSCTDLCSNTCNFADDGVCDDGGTNSVFDVCDLGTDCEDCGAR